MIDQILISGIIAITLFFFIMGKWRYDIIALLALFVTAILGLLPAEKIFEGFIHPVVLLIVAMLIISKALINSGAIDIISRFLNLKEKHPIIQLGILVTFTVFLSAFIHSMGALAFTVPIAVNIAKKTKTPLSMFLIPIAFASHFGGSMTLIGSASNMIISEFRADETIAFGFFEFSYVAAPVALASILFVTLIGWRLIPKRQDIFSQGISLEDFVAEIKVTEKSPIKNKTIRDFQNFSKEYFGIIGLVRGEHYINDPSPFTTLKENDILLIKAETDSLESIISTTKLELVKKESPEESKEKSKELETTETVLSNMSGLAGKSPKQLGLYRNYRINILALSRSGGEIKRRLADVIMKQGDVIIIQGYKNQVQRFINIFNLLPLREEEFRFEGKTKSALLAVGIFAFAILLASARVFPVHLIFVAAAITMVAINLTKPGEMYKSMDFMTIVLIAVMLQLGWVFQETGAAASLGNSLFTLPGTITPELALAIIFIASIWLSDILNNVAVAVLLAPVGLAMSQNLGVSFDPFLIAIALGAGSSYLTPTGHQSNVFVMGMGGYKFSDYWKIGLPLEVITFAVGFPLILHFWPF